MRICMSTIPLSIVCSFCNGVIFCEEKMKIKKTVSSFAAAIVLTVASFGAAADTIYASVNVGSSFIDKLIGTITIGSLSNLAGSFFAAEEIGYPGGFTLTLDNVTFTNGTVGALIDTIPDPKVFSFTNVGAGTYDVIATGFLTPTGQLHNASFLGVDYTVTAVPEPESYALMLAGLGLMGTIARRRSKKQA